AQYVGHRAQERPIVSHQIAANQPVAPRSTKVPGRIAERWVQEERQITSRLQLAGFQVTADDLRTQRAGADDQVGVVGGVREPRERRAADQPVVLTVYDSIVRIVAFHVDAVKRVVRVGVRGVTGLINANTAEGELDVSAEEGASSGADNVDPKTRAAVNDCLV